jgi:hypothetical protein
MLWSERVRVVDADMERFEGPRNVGKYGRGLNLNLNLNLWCQDGVDEEETWREGPTD